MWPINCESLEIARSVANQNLKDNVRVLKGYFVIVSPHRQNLSILFNDSLHPGKEINRTLALRAIELMLMCELYFASAVSEIPFDPQREKRSNGFMSLGYGRFLRRIISCLVKEN